MRISEVARRADVTTKTVRSYESLGLIAPRGSPMATRTAPSTMPGWCARPGS
ncbi:MerR family transcriptional regulator [Streptomyces sp. NPDC048211]|uniref:MerR family transcriptional regulator n=1 Tax=Streptomyces sp. NPDC048211 TaxID=3365516 RepID=UPI0037179E21